MAPPTLKAVRLEFSHGVERVYDAGHPPVADGARTVGGIGSSGLPHSPSWCPRGGSTLILNWDCFSGRGMSRWPSGMVTFSERLRNSRPFS